MPASASIPANPDAGHGGPRLHVGQPAGDLAALAAVDRARAHLLPQQGPITVFIHHNTLHALEDLPFHEALRKAAQIFGCQPYLAEDRYRDKLLRGRVRFAELQEVLEEDLGDRGREPVPGFGKRIDLRLAMLQYPLRIGPTQELVWHVAGREALRRVRPEVSSAVRARLIAETRRWVMRDLRDGNEAQDNGHGGRPGERSREAGLDELLDRFGEWRSRRGTRTTGSGSRSRRSGASAATACATCRRSPRRRPRRSGTATCCWRPPARTPTRSCTGS